jgi:hypothetical protein
MGWGLNLTSIDRTSRFSRVGADTRDHRQADVLESWLESITEGYQERILPVDLPAADRWARGGGEVSRRGAEAQGRRCLGWVFPASPRLCGRFP